MESPNLLQDSSVIAAVHVQVDQLSDEQIHWSSLLLLYSGSDWRIDIIDGVLDEHLFLLSNMLYRFLALHCL